MWPYRYIHVIIIIIIVVNSVLILWRNIISRKPHYRAFCIRLSSEFACVEWRPRNGNWILFCYDRSRIVVWFLSARCFFSLVIVSFFSPSASSTPSRHTNLLKGSVRTPIVRPLLAGFETRRTVASYIVY